MPVRPGRVRIAGRQKRPRKAAERVAAAAEDGSQGPEDPLHMEEHDMPPMVDDEALFGEDVEMERCAQA
jgi:hypothetical protein